MAAVSQCLRASGIAVFKNGLKHIQEFVRDCARSPSPPMLSAGPSRDPERGGEEGNGYAS